MRTENNINDLKNLENFIDCSNLDESHHLFSNKNEEVLGTFKYQTPKTVWTDEFIVLRSMASSFKFKDDNESKNKLKGVSKSQ